MRKKLTVFALIVGILLVLLSLVITLTAASRAEVIGGAGFPTLILYFQITSADSLAFAGVVIAVVAAVLLKK